MGEFIRKFVDDMQDPYLHIARINHFRYYEKTEWSKVLIECSPSVKAFVQWIESSSSASWIKVSKLYEADGIGESVFCTAMIRRTLPGGLNKFKISSDFWTHVKAFEWADPILPNGSVDEAAGNHASSPVSSFNFDGPVMGVIDVGIPILRESLGIRANRPAALWVQSGAIEGGVCAKDTAYGREISNLAGHPTDPAFFPAAQAVRDASAEEAFYINHRFQRLVRRASHGSAITDIVAGAADLGDWTAAYAEKTPRAAAASDVAAKAPLLAVDLPTQIVRYTSRAAMSAYILDALAWMLVRAGPKAQLFVNISLGTITGASKGQSILERAMDEWIAARKGRLSLVVPAGNARTSQCHASIPRGAMGIYVACLQVLPDDATPNFVEISIPQGVEGVSISVKQPNGVLSSWVSPGEILSLDNTFHIAYPAPSTVKGQSTTALIMIGATDRGDAPAGDWIIQVRMETPLTKAIDLWVERDEGHFLQPGPARQSKFIDPDPSHLGGLERQAQAAGALTSRAPGGKTKPLSVVISTEGTRSSITPKNAIIVGAMVASSGRRATYSGEGRNPADVTLYAWGDESPSLRGLRVAGTRSGDSLRLAGTSLAAPFVTRNLANKLSGASNGTLVKTPRQVKPAPVITNERVEF